jgi:hypothetical protein
MRASARIAVFSHAPIDFPPRGLTFRGRESPHDRDAWPRRHWNPPHRDLPAIAAIFLSFARPRRRKAQGDDPQTLEARRTADGWVIEL